MWGWYVTAAWFCLSICMRQAVEDMCQGFHTSVMDLSEQFMSQLRRRTYVTPTSYLELILAFKISLAKRRWVTHTVP